MLYILFTLISVLSLIITHYVMTNRPYTIKWSVVFMCVATGITINLHTFILSNHTQSNIEVLTTYFSDNQRKASDPYVKTRNLVKNKKIDISDSANIYGIRKELTNIIPIVSESYKKVLGNDYIPTITSGNDDISACNQQKHFNNLALDFSTIGISLRKINTIKSEIIRKIGAINRYSVSTNGDNIHIHYNVINEKITYEDDIIHAALSHSIEVSLVMAVIHKESQFNPVAKSGAGAFGLMQLMPLTAKYVNVQDSRDPIQNINGGTKYLKKMMSKYNNTQLALAAYNSGPGNIDNAIKKANSRSWDIVKNNLVTKDIYQAETIDYVDKITEYKKIYSYLYNDG